MVLENLTLFEVHLDDAQFTADAGGSSDSGETVTRTGTVDVGGSQSELATDDSPVRDESGRRDRGRLATLAVTGIVVSALALVARRRLSTPDDEGVMVDTGSDPETAVDRTDPVGHEEMQSGEAPSGSGST